MLLVGGVAALVRGDVWFGAILVGVLALRLCAWLLSPYASWLWEAVEPGRATLQRMNRQADELERSRVPGLGRLARFSNRGQWWRQPASLRTDESSEIDPEQERINTWVRQGWREVWDPTSRNPKRRQRLWGRAGNDGLMWLLAGTDQPPAQNEPVWFYINDRRVYPGDEHPEGPSSIPWYVVKVGKMYPEEGYRSGADEAAHFELRRLQAKDVATVVRTNPAFGKSWPGPESD